MRCCVAAFAMTLALAGCAASGPTGREVLSLGAKPGTARLVIYRTSPAGLLIQPDYLVNGKKVASSQPNGFVVCVLPPGKHSISVGNLPSIPLGPGTDSITVSLRAGTTAYVHAQPRSGLMTPGTIVLSHVSESQGRADTAELYRIEGDCGRG